MPESEVIPHPLALVVVWLTDQITVPVAGNSMPDDQASFHVGPYIILRATGGVEDDSYAPVWEPRVDLRAYGPTWNEAWETYMPAHTALRNLSRTTVSHGQYTGILYNARHAGGPTEGIEDTWPFVLGTFQVRMGQRSLR